MHWSLQLQGLFLFAAPPNVHSGRHCGFLTLRPIDETVPSYCSTKLRGVEKESECARSTNQCSESYLGAGGGGSSLGCLGPADTPGLIGVLTSSSMDPMSPLGLLILSILNNLDSVNSFGPTVTMAVTTTSTPPTVRLPFFHMAPDVRPLCYLYTFLCLSYHESPLCCPHWTFATTLL